MNGSKTESDSERKIAKDGNINKTMSSTYDIAIRASEELIDMGQQVQRTSGQSDLIKAEISATWVEVERLSDAMADIERLNGEFDEFAHTQMGRNLEALRCRIERLHLLMDCAYAAMDVVCIRNAEVSEMIKEL